MRSNIIGRFSASMLLSLIFVSCSQNVGSTADDTNISEVETTLELDKCTDSLLGETVFVTEEDVYYTCIREKWVKMDVDAESSSSRDESSSSKEKSSSSTKEETSSSSEQSVVYGTFTDKRDKRTYKTISIGNQTWMAENLNYGDSVATPSLKGNSWCYDNVAANCDESGRLYTWAAAIDSVKLAGDKENPQVCGSDTTCTLPAKVQGICPDGWRLPQIDDWKTLITAASGAKTKSTALKSASGWGSGGNGTNSSGFSALPAGHRYIDGNFYNVGIEANFWIAVENNSNDASCMSFFDRDETALFSLGDKEYGFSVRCIEDSDLDR